MVEKKRKNLGAHMSIAGGVEEAPKRGASVGCSAMQIFTKNSNQWKAKPLESKNIDEWFKNIEEAKITSVASHDSYLINLASPDKEALKKSLDAFVEEIKRADQLKIPLLVFHPGSHLKAGEEEGLLKVADSMNRAIDETSKQSDVLLAIETTAGQGTNLGHRFEHIAYLIDKVENKNRVGVCVDTCHIFAAGYDIRTEKEYKKTFKEFDRLIGIDKIKIFHVNDSKKDFGTRVDRHEQIGEGFIGLDAFGFLMNDKRFANIPMVLETPKGKELEEDKINLKLLRSLIR